MASPQATESLAPDIAARVAEFARACKAATRIVSLYPQSHPSIQSALARMVEAGRQATTSGPLTLTVLPETLQVDGRGLARPEASVNELAALLHQHRIGALTIRGALPGSLWHTFLSLLARPPEEVRGEGGVARVWQSSGVNTIELAEIDYAEVLREHDVAGQPASWERILANCLEGDEHAGPEGLAALLEIAEDPERLADFTERMQERGRAHAGSTPHRPVVHMMHGLANYAAHTTPHKVDDVLDHIAEAATRLSPESMLALINDPAPTVAEGQPIDLAAELRARFTDERAARFVATNVVRDRGATERLATAFHTLVSDPSRRERVLSLAAGKVKESTDPPQLDEMWSSSVEMLTSYSDAPYVSAGYAHELTSARSQAIEVERTGDDPPERIEAWLSTVRDAGLALDHQLILDLLSVEERPDAWVGVLDVATAQIEQLVQANELGLAIRLHEALVAVARGGGDPRFADPAASGLSRLASGPLVGHLVPFMRQASDADVARASEFCRTIGPELIGPLAEALAAEENTRTVRHLRDVLVSFGSAVRAHAKELRRSPNPEVRRVAIDLWRTLGGDEVLPDLRSLLDDTAPQVQREALRAIVQIGTNEAYATLEHALKAGEARTRETILQALGSLRDDRAAPLLVYMLAHSSYRGSLEGAYTSFVDALGRVGGDRPSVEALRAILYRGDWWAPGRTARIRTAAARALRAAGTDAATQALDAAVTNGPGGVKRAARAALAEPAPRSAARRTT